MPLIVLLSLVGVGQGAVRLLVRIVSGFQGFVALRYLMARPRRVSIPVLYVAGVLLTAAIACFLLARLVFPPPDPRAFLPPDDKIAMYLSIATGAILAVFVIVVYTGVVRYFFTFFTTVSIVGVTVGTAALVIVLSVMGGFENDLREKILGSNAHILITRVDGDFTEWEAVRAKLDRIDSVRAHTPYATSEVVIAANNSYATVIIKGIDPVSVGAVTELTKDVEDPESIARLSPLVKDDLPGRVVEPDGPGPDGPGGDGGVLDPAPDDLTGEGDPIDYSGPAGRDRDGGPAADPGGPASADDDRAPADLGVAPEGPIDFSGDDDDEPARTIAEAILDEYEDHDGDAGAGGGDAGARPGRDGGTPAIIGSLGGPDDDSVVIRDLEGPLPGRIGSIEPRGSARIAALHGVLVGRELVKQIHLYPGQEVRLVSPLSDPSNPDATGTPIPFNRDYRVAGIFYTGMYEYDLKFVYVELESLQEFLDLGDAVTGIEVRIDDPDETSEVAERIKAALGPDYRVQDWKELNRSLFSALKLEKIAMFLVLAIIILVASFSIVGNLIMVVVEKAREIAVLKTLGASDSRVMGVFVIQGLIIGLVGTMVGVGYGLATCGLVKVPINPDVYYIDHLPIHIDWGAVGAVGAAGLVISILATLYPAFLAARMRPAAGLRVY